jgi:hypothetical protein
MFEVMVIARHADEPPSCVFQHPDKLAAVAFDAHGYLSIADW